MYTELKKHFLADNLISLRQLEMRWVESGIFQYRSRFKLFPPKFSNISVHVPSKTTQLTCFCHLKSIIVSYSGIMSEVFFLRIKWNLQASGCTQTTLLILCQKSKYRLECLLVWKIYDWELSLIVFSAKIYNTVVSVKCIMWELCRSPLMSCLKTIMDFKWQGSLSSFRLLTGWGLHRFVWKSQHEKLN